MFPFISIVSIEIKQSVNTEVKNFFGSIWISIFFLWLVCYRTPACTGVSYEFCLVRLSFLRIGWLLVFIFCMKLEFNKHQNVKKSFFEESLVFAQNGVDAQVFGPKSTLLNFSQYFLYFLFIKFFWNCLMKGIKSGLRLLL